MKNIVWKYCKCLRKKTQIWTYKINMEWQHCIMLRVRISTKSSNGLSKNRMFSKTSEQNLMNYQSTSAAPKIKILLIILKTSWLRRPQVSLLVPGWRRKESQVYSERRRKSSMIMRCNIACIRSIWLSLKIWTHFKNYKSLIANFKHRELPLVTSTIKVVSKKNILN